jgi:type IV secretory pathway VirB9-like protein
MRRGWLLLLNVLLAPPAFALDECQPTPTDPQVRTCIYNVQQRYVVRGVIGFPTNIQVGQDEVIKRTEFAQTGRDKNQLPEQTWTPPRKKENQVVEKDRYQNNLPIWPWQAGTSALNLVTSRKDGSERSYLFVLLARPAGSDCVVDPKAPACPDDVTTTTSLVFAYPSDVAAAAKRDADAKHEAAVQAWRESRAVKREQAAVDRLRVDVMYGPQNKDYYAKGQKKYAYLAPKVLTDNGMLTQFQWPGNVEVPTISIFDEATNSERIVVPAQQGQMFVVPTTAKVFRLRLGKEAVLDMHNRRWNAERPDPETGTTSPDVVRTVVYQDQMK